MSEDLLFVFGAPKTCTSTIIGMLNCHPDIFIMSEAFHNKNIKHGSKIYDYYKTPPRKVMSKRGDLGAEMHKVKSIIESKDKKI